MRRFRPIHGLLLVAILVIPFVAWDFVAEGWLGQTDFVRVTPDAQGAVRIDVGDLEAGTVRFYRFLNPGNQEVKLFVGRDGNGTVQVAFDANEICFKHKRGYRVDGEWMVCRFCDKAFRLAEVNEGRGGCAPIPIEHHLEGDELVIAEHAILEGWRYFR